MRKVAVFILSLLLITSVSTIYGQEVTPQYLELTVYNDGTVKAVYDVETDPIEVRVDVDLFGSSFSNLVVRDDENLPIGLPSLGVHLDVPVLWHCIPDYPGYLQRGAVRHAHGAELE